MTLRKILGDNAAVAIIDMQWYFLRHFSTEKVEEMAQLHERLIQACIDEDVLLLTVKSKRHGGEINYLTESAKRVKRKFKIIKGEDDAFKRTGLQYYIDLNELDTVLFAGINAGCCVRETAKSALNLGYKITSGEGLISDFESWRMDTARTWFKQNGIWIQDPKTELLEEYYTRHSPQV